MAIDRAETNRRFYDALWSEARIEPPERFNTWPVVLDFLRDGFPRLEIGPGLRPRLPLASSVFVDASRPAATRIRSAGGHAIVADAAALPFADSCFSLVAAFDLIEHLPDDRAVFGEIRRVLVDDGRLVFAVPLHAEAWTDFDELVGHYRRYDPGTLVALLEEHGFVIEQSAVFGMQPRNPWLLRLGMWVLRKNRARAMRWYNHVLLPLAIFFQRPLRFERGLLPTDGVDEVVLVCGGRGR